MTSPTGDLPDWTFAQNTIVTSTTDDPLGAGGTIGGFPQSSTAMVLIVRNTVADEPIRITFTWYVGAGNQHYAYRSTLSTVELAGQGNELSVEIPVFGDQWELQNLGSNAVDFRLFGTNRVVDRVTHLPTLSSTDVWQMTDNFVNGVSFVIINGILGPYYYPANGDTTIVAESDTDGVLGVYYYDKLGEPHTYDLATLTAGTQVAVSEALPQAGLVFTFTPTDDNPAGNIAVYANAAAA